MATRLAAVGGVALCGGLLALTALAWKNGLVFGEPLAPLLYLDGGSSGVLNQVWFSPENTDWIVRTYPIALTLGKYPMQHGNLSVLVLAFVPMLLVVWWGGTRLPRESIVLALAALVGLGAWIVLRPSVLAPRYILPQIICLVPLIAGATDAWLRSSGQRVAVALVVVALVGHTALIAHQAGNDWKRTQLYATGRKPDSLLVGGDSLVAKASPRGRFLVASWYKSYMPAEVLLCTVGAAEKQRLAQPALASSADMWKRLYRNGVTDVFMYRLTHPLILGQEPATDAAPPWLAVEEEVFSPIVSVFRIRPRDGAPPRGPTCDESRAARVAER